jgi:oligoribonuclease NrnB/cAMP/cGMP phosphodiesterase (DHH superfamily)
MFNTIMVKIGDLRGSGIVIISDLGVNAGIEKLCIEMITRIKQTRWKVIWVDHHPWPKKAMKLMNKITTIVHDDSGRSCAAELMYKYFVPRNKVAKQLSVMAHSSDFMIDIESIPPVSSLIQYYRNLSNPQEKLTILARKSATGILWDTEMQEDYLRYLSIYSIEKGKALNSILIRSIQGFKVAFVPVSDYIQTSLFAKNVFDTTHADLALFYKSDGKISIRRNNARISCRRIADSLIEGGGHDFAAGGKLAVDLRNVNNIPTKLEQLVTQSLCKQYMLQNASGE